MILLIHALFGAAIGSITKNIPLALILAFLSHYFLDLIPHIEYSVQKNWSWRGRWRKVLYDILKVALDFWLGFLFVFIFYNASFGSSIIVYSCAFMAILPDIISLFSRALPYRFLKTYDYLHVEKIHFLKHKKISNFWRILSQIVIFAISIIILKA